MTMRTLLGAGALALTLALPNVATAQRHGYNHGTRRVYTTRRYSAPRIYTLSNYGYVGGFTAPVYGYTYYGPTYGYAQPGVPYRFGSAKVYFGPGGGYYGSYGHGYRHHRFHRVPHRYR